VIDVRSAEASETEHVVGCVVAAFITDPLARFAWPKPHDHLRGMSAATRAFAGGSFEQLFRDTAEPLHLDDLLGTFEKMAEWHPEEPHWYLPIIGVEPNAQGRGLGGALLRHAVARCDRENLIAYLESSNPRNITLYERHGFERMGEIKVGKGPLVTPMLRQPR
jgi:ribosomal protein S18 acetylase RimI-like enzyme